MDQTITQTWELGTIVRKAAMDMPNAPSVSIAESDRSCTLRGEGVEFSARLGEGWAEFSYRPINDVRGPYFDKWTRTLPDKSDSWQEGGAYKFRTPNRMDAIYNAMSAMFYAHNDVLNSSKPVSALVERMLK